MDFGRWFARSAAETPVPPDDTADILEKMGLDLMKDGRVIGRCCICEQDICWTDYLSIEQILRDGVGAEYCGGSPRCCP